MAHMYPKIREKIKAPNSEQMAYDELCTLSDDYTVFHSFSWIRPHTNRNFTWYQNDYLILHRYYGILILEVKGGQISFEDNLMHQTNLVTKEETVLDEGDDPLNQANRAVQHFRKLIQKEALELNGRISIESAIWFPGCEFDPNQDMPQNYKDLSFAILDSSAFHKNSGVKLQKRIEEIFRRYGAAQKTALQDWQMDWIKNQIAPDFELMASPSMVKTEIDNAFIRLTDEQSVLLDYISEQGYATIQGAAGTGKTLIANMAAERFGNQGRKVLFLCYNAFLYSYLKNDCAKINVSYFNVDRFVTDEYSMVGGDPVKRLAAYRTIEPDGFPYDDIVIDEAQDLGNQEVLFFKQLMEQKNGHLYVFYDKNQVVLHSRSKEDDEGNEPLSWINESECRLLLTKNCRNTIEIANTSYSVIGYNVKHKNNDISGDQPGIVFAETDPASKLAAVIRQYLDKGFTQDEITVLTMKTETDTFLKGIQDLDGIRLKSSPDQTGLLFTTARKFKGLENKVIIVVDIDEDCFSDQEKMNVFYVACSRAMQGLTLIVDGDTEKINRIASAIPGGSWSSRGKIIMKTKTKSMKF